LEEMAEAVFDTSENLGSLEDPSSQLELAQRLKRRALPQSFGRPDP